MKQHMRMRMSSLYISTALLISCSAVASAAVMPAIPSLNRETRQVKSPILPFNLCDLILDCSGFDSTPVCSSDGTTHDNVCQFEKHACGRFDIFKAYNGPCIEDCNVTSCLNQGLGLVSPAAEVCGSDGRTYHNQCTLEVIRDCNDSSLTVQSTGSCSGPGVTNPCDQTICTTENAPVCGSDGVTYSNDCGLNLASCRDPSITKAYDGECSGPGVTNPCDQTICTTEYAPVCGSDGVTYSNDCGLNLASCSDPSITKAYDGECSGPGVTNPCDQMICTTEYAPVCGSDGVTYSNDCGLNLASCRDPSITKAYDGECSANTGSCDRVVCTMEYAPVCGSDGVTYGNDCNLFVASCRDPSIIEAHDGECKDGQGNVDDLDERMKMDVDVNVNINLI